MVVVDYYKLLQVQRNAKDDDLKKAAEAKHKQISEAYDVLSDPRKRALYDQQREEGSPGSGGQFGRSRDRIFTEFFEAGAGGSRVADSPREDVFSFFGERCDLGESRASGSRSIFGDDIYSVKLGGKTKAAAIERTLPCSLEDLYKGTTKKLKISRDVVGASGRRSTVEEVLTVDIKPGWKKGTKITFLEKGNDVERGVIPADIIFIIDEKPHSLFKRDGDDLIVPQKISLAEALTGHTHLTTLDGRNLRVSIDSITSLTHEEVVKGEGMPIQKEHSKKGNLIVKFNIKFPKLTSEQKAGIKQLLTSS